MVFWLSFVLFFFSPTLLDPAMVYKQPKTITTAATETVLRLADSSRRTQLSITEWLQGVSELGVST